MSLADLRRSVATSLGETEAFRLAGGKRGPMTWSGFTDVRLVWDRISAFRRGVKLLPNFLVLAFRSFNRVAWTAGDPISSELFDLAF